MRDVSDRIDEAAANAYFERLDPLVRPGTVLFVIGGSAIAQLGAKIRVTADIDVALPYSTFEMSEFVAASAKAGLPVDPAFGYQGAYVELVKPLMLTLPKPASVDDCIVLFQGANLTVRTSGPADLVASKLYRYSEQDQEDVQFLMRSGGVTLRLSARRSRACRRGSATTSSCARTSQTSRPTWKSGKGASRDGARTAADGV